MVNRNDETVRRCSSAVGRCSSTASPPSLVGRHRTGRFLRAAHKSPAIPAQKDELTSVGWSTVLDMWAALSARDWEGLKSYLSRGLHATWTCRWDPRPRRRGPTTSSSRLKIGLEPLASYENFTGLLVVDGADAMYEHHEEWHWGDR